MEIKNVKEKNEIRTIVEARLVNAYDDVVFKYAHHMGYCVLFNIDTIEWIMDNIVQKSYCDPKKDADLDEATPLIERLNKKLNNETEYEWEFHCEDFGDEKFQPLIGVEPKGEAMLEDSGESTWSQDGFTEYLREVVPMRVVEIEYGSPLDRKLIAYVGD